PDAVARLSPAVRAPDAAAVDLAAEGEPVLVGADLGAQPRAVLGHVLRVVPRQPSRLSVSNGAALTPPTRVENAATYGPGASQRSSGRDCAVDRVTPAPDAGSRSAPWRRPAPTRGRRARRAACGGAAPPAPPPPSATVRGRARRGRCP